MNVEINLKNNAFIYKILTTNFKKYNLGNIDQNINLSQQVIILKLKKLIM